MEVGMALREEIERIQTVLKINEKSMQSPEGTCSIQSCRRSGISRKLPAHR